MLKAFTKRITRMFYKIYDLHFRSVKRLIDYTARIKYRPVGLVLGTLLLEFGPSLRSAARRLRYRRPPHYYGFDLLRPEHRHKSPVLLLHGSMGKWSDVAALGHALKQAGIPVFVMNFLHAHNASEAERKRIYEKIEQIQLLYKETFNIDPPRVDLIGHSLGGMMALYCSFTPECCYIDESDPTTLRRDRLVMKEGQTPTRYPHIGKVITIGMPSNVLEVRWVLEAGNEQQLFNILAQYDAIIGDMEWSLKSTVPMNTFELNKGHLGVLSKAAFQKIIQWLTQK